VNAAPSKPKAPAKAPTAAASTAPAKASAKPAPATPVAADGMPARSARPSSRLAQLTVPSIQQSAASTAAKASYTNTMPTTLQAPRAAVPVKKDPKLANHWKTKPLEELTDADVLAMPDSEYMNDVQMAFFRRKLVQLKQDMHNNAGETTEHLREAPWSCPDPADRATIEEEARPGAAHPRPRAQAAQEDRAVHLAHRRGRLRLLRRNRRTIGVGRHHRLPIES